VTDLNLSAWHRNWKAHQYAVTAGLVVGSTLWTASVGGCVRVWNTDTFQELHEYYPFRTDTGCIKHMIHISFPDGEQQVWASSPQEDRLYIWDVESMELVHYLPLPNQTKATTLCGCILPLNEGDMDIYVLAGDASGQVHIIHARTLQHLASWEAHNTPISGIVAPNSKPHKIWTASRLHPEMKIWKVEDEQILLHQSATSHASGVSAMHYDHPTRTLFSASGSSIVYWNMNTQRAVQDLAGHQGSVVSLTGQGNMLFSGGKGGLIIKWSKRDKFVTKESPTPGRWKHPGSSSLSQSSARTKETQLILAQEKDEHDEHSSDSDDPRKNYRRSMSVEALTEGHSPPSNSGSTSPVASWQTTKSHSTKTIISAMSTSSVDNRQHLGVTRRRTPPARTKETPPISLSLSPSSPSPASTLASGEQDNGNPMLRANSFRSTAMRRRAERTKSTTIGLNRTKGGSAEDLMSTLESD